MIKNEKQYRITQKQAERFRQAIAKLGSPNAGENPVLFKAQKDALNSQLEELEEQLQEYRKLTSGKSHVFKAESLAELAHSLIRARIAEGLTQKDLADRLGLKEQQVQRYEATDYQSASLSRLVEVGEALGLTVTTSVRAPER